MSKPKPKEKNKNKNRNWRVLARAIEKEKEIDTISVSEARRKHSGFVRVRGMITTFKEHIKMVKGTIEVCNFCRYKSNQKIYDIPQFSMPSNSHSIISSNGHGSKSKTKCPQCSESGKNTTECDYTNAIIVGLKDLGLSEIENLQVILFDNDTVDIHIGQQVIIEGNLRIIPQHRLSLFLLASSIKYEQIKEVTLSPEDVREVKKFVSDCNDNNENVLNKLASKFAPSIIGYKHEKKGLLMVASSTSLDLKKPKIHAILVGEVGLAKSPLIRKTVDLVPNSHYESGQGATGKSLTAIVSREEDKSETLRYGVLPLSRGGICAINELGRVDFRDQSHFLDVMQEQSFTINKYGINARIEAPTAIIASANPTSGEWPDKEYIDLNEIPIITPLRDRFDLVFTFRANRNEKDVREYAYSKAEMEDVDIDAEEGSNHEYLKKHIMYAKQFNPKFSEEAKSRLNECYVSIATKFGSRRIRETIFKLAKAIARLKLKDTVDSDDAKETTEYYNLQLQQYQQQILLPHDPRDITYKTCLDILMDFNSPYEFEELIKTACSRNEQVSRYIGLKYKLEHNKKLRPILDMLRNHSEVIIIKKKPWVLQYRRDNPQNNAASDLTDPTDPTDPPKTPQNGQKERKTERENGSKKAKSAGSERSDRSERSDGSDRNSDSGNLKIIHKNHKNLEQNYQDEGQKLDLDLELEPQIVQSPYKDMIEKLKLPESGITYYRCKCNIWKTDLDQILAHCKNEHR